MPHYQGIRYPFVTPPELRGEASTRYPVAIVGAGPIGLAMAIDLAMHGIRSVVLDDNNVVSVGSRAICWAKRTLEIFDRLGVADRMLEKGVTWKVGRLFHGENEVYNFDLLPNDSHKMPAFINLQQYYVEQYLVDRTAEFPDLIEVRWLSKVVGEDIGLDQVTLQVETPEGTYDLAADYVLACDGAKSAIRDRMGLAFKGQHFEERFLIADVKMAESPFDEEDTHERWFWFEPPFHQGQSSLLHKQPDNIYRIDLQLGPDTDPVAESKPENVIPRIKAIVGDRPFELDWVSVYSFTCAKLDQFVHGRVIFVGDSAHTVSPFGARGGNGGIQDVDNLGWKLAAVLQGRAEPVLLDSYDEERSIGAQENIKNSSRATNFMTPKSKMERIFRNEILKLAKDYPFARTLVNSGRLSVPCSLAGLSLQTKSTSTRGLTPGTPCPDAALEQAGENSWLLNHLGGEFVLLTIGSSTHELDLTGARHLHVTTDAGGTGLYDCEGNVAQQYGNDLAYLIRPDQHIAACFGLEETEKLLPSLHRAQSSEPLEAAQ
ncbi:FAD-dependent oxidoreductase [Sneathiella marina]|uniref:FAD-dependent oxidoreductase n=1 Tax=Sneathiella marina TaxID=2950108 RepID=A0ABY4W2W7_9PROT|nr:FAD-dependent oxidoreductase [Sneathiella marina]USG61521.1 FAD-dependent oxidoreductase [Sneathiella marina]